MALNYFKGRPLLPALTLCLGAALLAGVAVQNYITSKKISNIKLENRQLSEQNERLSEQLTRLSDAVSQLGKLPLAYAETPQGLKLVPAEFGVTKDDLDFLKRFRGPLLDLNTDFKKLSADQIKQLLQIRIVTEFERDPQNLKLGKTKRRALITFAMLRVNGSMPTYEVRDAVPNDFRSMVLGTSGNCSDFTIRVMIVAEALGLKAALISANTPALPGHVFADVYDPEEDTAYMLDSNFDVRIARTHTGGRGFFEALLTSSVNEQEVLSEKAKVKALPVYFRFIDPGEKGLYGTPLTASYVNAIRSEREETWRRWTSEDLDDLVAWWKRTPTHRPRTLAEFNEFLPDIPSAFNSSGDYAERLRKVAGVNFEVAGGEPR
ncbi:hypothetical protein AB4Z13_31325 [Rhizobium sp. YAF28]|uniref:hypothetical protein n=1 Tax=Rhizobium sp. YAF28 TaxID=3233081 RepID=UPI003F9579DE